MVARARTTINQDLKGQLKDLQTRLDRAYKREEDDAKLKAEPIAFSKEFMALSESELSRLMDCFERIDKDQYVARGLGRRLGLGSPSGSGIRLGAEGGLGLPIAP